jgi:hypothetical protein
VKIANDVIKIIVDELMVDVGYWAHEHDDGVSEERVEEIITRAFQKMTVREGYIFDEKSEIEWHVQAKTQEEPGDVLVLTVP